MHLEIAERYAALGGEVQVGVDTDTGAAPAPACAPKTLAVRPSFRER